MLSSPIYRARLSDEPKAPAGRWPALVDAAAYQRVQERIASDARTPRQASGRYALPGLLRCPGRGSRMAGWLRQGGPPYYRCNGSLRGTDAADPRCVTMVRASFLDDVVLGEVRALLDRLLAEDPALAAALRRTWECLRHPTDGTDAAARIRSPEQEADKVKRRLTRAAELFADGELDKVGYDGLRHQARADLDAIEAERGRLAGATPPVALPPLDEVLWRVGGWSAALTETDVPAMRDVLVLVLDHTVPVRLGRGQYDARIVWTPLGDALSRGIDAA